MALINYWCFCIDLAFGNQIYAWAQIFFSIYVFFRGFSVISANKEVMKTLEGVERNLLDQYSFFIWLCFLVHFVNIIVLIIFIQGIKKRIASKLKPYLCVKVVNIFIYFMMILHFGIEPISGFILGVIAVELYFFLCSCSLHSEFYRPYDEGNKKQPCPGFYVF